LLQFIRQVVGLEVLVGARQIEPAAKLVAAIFGNDVDPHAASTHRRIGSGDIDLRFLLRLDVRPGHAEIAGRSTHRHVVDRDPLIAKSTAVDDERGAVVAGGSTRVLRGACLTRRTARGTHPGNEHTKVDEVLARRNRFDDFVGQHLLARRPLDVDERSLAADGDGFFDGADRQFRVHRCREVARQLDAFPLERVEAGERKRHRIHPGTQVDETVLAAAIGDDGTDQSVPGLPPPRSRLAGSPRRCRGPRR
jgi:hypothetical protein